MHKWLAACLAIGLIVASPVFAEQFGFSDSPAEQSLVRPGDEPQIEPVAQPSAQPALQQQQPMHAPVEQSQEVDNDNAFFLKPTYVSQEDFNIFKRQLVQVLKDNQDKNEALSKQLFDMKVQVQQVEPQMNSLKQIILQISKLLPGPGQLNAVALVIWQQGWFWLLLTWNVLLSLLVSYLLWTRPKREIADNQPDNGGDYDFMSAVDSLPGHLELAKTYVAMLDYGHARRSLEFIVMHDRGELKQQALSLLKQLPKKG